MRNDVSITEKQIRKNTFLQIFRTKDMIVLYKHCNKPRPYFLFIEGLKGNDI